MTIFQTPGIGDEERGFNVVIGYLCGKAIIQDEYNNLFYIECEPEHMPIGTFVEDGGMAPVVELSEKEKKIIYEQFREIENDIH